MGLTSGWVKINSPRAGSSVYPFTPDPVERTKLADDPYMVYPAATISLPGRNTSSMVPVESGFCFLHRTLSSCALIGIKWPHDLVDAKDSADVYTGIDITAAVEGVEHDAIFAFVAALDENGVL